MAGETISREPLGSLHVPFSRPPPLHGDMDLGLLKILYRNLILEISKRESSPSHTRLPQRRSCLLTNTDLGGAPASREHGLVVSHGVQGTDGSRLDLKPTGLYRHTGLQARGHAVPLFPH